MKNKTGSVRVELDAIQVRMTCAIDSVWAVHEAMGNGSCAVENYLDALYGAYDHLRMLNDELAKTIDGMREKAVAV